jgi:tetratricopeptide (TPR) repeat protein
MLRSSIILPSLFLASSILPIVVLSQRAIALSVVEVNSTAYQVSVQIIGGNAVGTGTIVRQQGDRYTVLTAAHVLRRSDTYKVIAPDGKTYPVVSADFASLGSGAVDDRGLDLAAVSFISPQAYEVARIGDSAATKIGESVYSAGFPGHQPTYTFSSGKVQANSNRNFRQGYSLLFQSQKIAPGMSGGGIFNQRGELIAITGISIGTKGNSIQEGLVAGITTRRFLPWTEKINLSLTSNFGDLYRASPMADDFLVSAMDKNDRRDVRGAIADYTQAIALKPNYTIAYYRRGLSKEQIGDRRGAIADYSRTIALNPLATDAYLARGLNKGILGDWQTALQDYDSAIAINPDNAFAYGMRGLNKSILGDWRGSLGDYDRAISLRPYFPDNYLNRAAVKEKLGDLKGVLADYDRAITLQPNLPGTYEQRAAIKQQLHDRQGAIGDLYTAAQLYRQQGNMRGLRLLMSHLQRLKQR